MTREELIKNMVDGGASDEDIAFAMENFVDEKSNEELARERFAQANPSQVQTPDLINLTELNQKAREDKTPSPYIYQAIATKDIPIGDFILKKGELIDQLNLPEYQNPDDVKLRWGTQKSYLSTFNPSDYEIKYSISQDPKVVQDYISIHGGESPILTAIFPRLAQNVINPEATLGTKAAASIGDISSYPGRLVGSYLGNIGSDNYLENVAKDISNIGSEGTTNLASNMLQSVLRDPTTPYAIATGIPFVKSASTPLKGAVNIQEALSLAKPIENFAKGSSIGLGQTLGQDVLNDYATGQNNVTPIDYAIGATLGGALGVGTPKVTQFIENRLGQTFKAPTFHEYQPKELPTIDGSVTTTIVPTEKMAKSLGWDNFKNIQDNKNIMYNYLKDEIDKLPSNLNASEKKFNFQSNFNSEEKRKLQSMLAYISSKVEQPTQFGNYGSGGMTDKELLNEFIQNNFNKIKSYANDNGFDGLRIESNSHETSSMIARGVSLIMEDYNKSKALQSVVEGIPNTLNQGLFGTLKYLQPTEFKVVPLTQAIPQFYEDKSKGQRLQSYKDNLNAMKTLNNPKVKKPLGSILR